MNSILDYDLILKGKKVIVRVDLNVPMKDGVITEASVITPSFIGTFKSTLTITFFPFKIRS